MLSRRSFSLSIAALAASAAAVAPALSATQQTFDAKAFAEAQAAGKPILVAVHASWCPTCKAQAPILGKLLADPKFKDLVFLVVDFDAQKDVVKRFGVRTQSTLIAFNGASERARSVGDTDADSIAALVNKAL
jgi:thioredoxin 1